MLTLLIVLGVLGTISKAVGILVGTYLLFRAFGWVHQSSPRLAWVLVAGVVFTTSIAALGVNYLKRAKVEARAEANAEVVQQRRAAAEQALAEDSQRAQAERDARTALVERWHVARRTAIEEWGKALVAAGALGDQGVAPPMLDIRDTGSLVSVTNRAPGPACVLIQRFGINESGAHIRCAVGGYRCVVIRSGETRRLPTLGGAANCASRLLEFRVGDVDHPETGWWSKSAFDAFGSVDPGPDFEPRWSDAFLRAEIGRLDKQMKDRMPVER
jgi:hypothetical protein